MSVIRSQCKSYEEYLLALRDDFAAKAMEGLIQSPDQVTEPFDGIAQSAYLMANEMLKARES